MTPTTPRLSRNASSSSPITTIFFGGPSASGNSPDSNTGNQKRRSSSPIPVPAPLSVRNLLSSARSMKVSSGGFASCFGQSLAQAERGVNACVAPHPEELAKQASRRMDAKQELAAILRDARKGALLRMRSEIYFTTAKAGHAVSRAA